jgi:hypothetical protein
MPSEGLGELRLIVDASAGVLLDHSDVLVTVYTIHYDLQRGISCSARSLVSRLLVSKGSSWQCA